MEFKYRAVDDRSAPTPTPSKNPSSPRPPSLPTVTYFSEHSLVGGLKSAVPNPISNTLRMPVNDAGDAFRREMEKAQIRREIIASEVARRLELEEEVRRELMLERRGWGVPMQRDFGASVAAASPSRGLLSFEERVATRFRPGVIYAVPKPQIPQLMAPPVPLETEPSPDKNNKDKVIVLAKPNPDLYAAKRKAVTPPVVDGCDEHPPFGSTKKPKEGWSCSLCQVSTTSERGLNEHFQGKKHRAKEASLRPQMISKSTTHKPESSRKSKMPVKSTEAITTATSGLDAKADRSSLQPSITGGDIYQRMVEKGVVESKNVEQLVQKSQTTEGLKNKDGTEIATGPEAGRANVLKRTETKFRCDICQVETFSHVVMESHRKGKRHLNQMKKKFSPNNGSSQPASSAPQEPPVLIEERNVVNKEPDQKLTDALT